MVERKRWESPNQESGKARSFKSERGLRALLEKATLLVCSLLAEIMLA